MKTIYKALTCLLLVSFLAAGLAAVPHLASAQGEPDRLAEMRTVIAKKVSEIPVIDGDFSDPAWAEAATTAYGPSRWQAVYTDDEMAMHVSWVDHDANIDQRGTWNWDADAQSWWRTGWEPGTWEGFSGERHPEWMSIAFDINSEISDASMADIDVGCGATCHEYPPGSGKMHHGTWAPGAYIDLWYVMFRHAFGPGGSLEDMGFIQGGTSVSQSPQEELIFNPSDPVDVRGVINGRITFAGYLDDRILGSWEDPEFVARENPGDLYCLNCHRDLGLSYEPLEIDYTRSDVGTPAYRENWNEDQSAPLYMELAPENFMDCMALTQAEIDAGEAVLIADLSEAEIGKAWDNYAALNGVVPQHILQEPTESHADVQVAATWENGYWNLELKRKLVTGYDDDVQFDDLSKDYHFGVTQWSHRRFIGAEEHGTASWTLRFEQ
ncbi:MAG: hypothetical protein KJ047_06765 [Anaerolineae bacterium]|nr:hypothetical protein [Anaerolineae bacterium]